MRSPEEIMASFDKWVCSRGSRQYINATVDDAKDPRNVPPFYDPPIQQVRREVYEFVKVLCGRGLDGTAVEIGLGYNGGSHMLWRGIFQRVVTIEKGREWIDKFRSIEGDLDERSVILLADANTPAAVEEARKIATGVDLLFIDGDHEYEEVKRQYELWHGTVRRGGIIAFHDIMLQAVLKVVLELEEGLIDGTQHKFERILHSLTAGVAWEIVE